MHRRAYIAAAAGFLRIAVARLSSTSTVEDAEKLRECGESSLKILDCAAASSVQCLLDRVAPNTEAASGGRRALADLVEDALCAAADVLNPASCNIAARLNWPSIPSKKSSESITPPVLAGLALFSPAVPPRARAAALLLMRRSALAFVQQAVPRHISDDGREIDVVKFNSALHQLTSLFAESAHASILSLAQLAAGGRRRGASDVDMNAAVGWWAAAVAICEGAVGLPANPFKLSV